MWPAHLAHLSAGVDPAKARAAADLYRAVSPRFDLGRPAGQAEAAPRQSWARRFAVRRVAAPAAAIARVPARPSSAVPARAGSARAAHVLVATPALPPLHREAKPDCRAEYCLGDV